MGGCETERERSQLRTIQILTCLRSAFICVCVREREGERESQILDYRVCEKRERQSLKGQSERATET